MEVARSHYLPGDPRLIDNIVYELKSQGIFDNFRKECISDVDTKPAYQNLRQRVEGSVSGFLKTQQWNPNMNKNQVREMLRKTISESGFLETGVERIVDQVVNPKINSIFFPQVENIVYKFLGVNIPIENNTKAFISNSNLTDVAINDLLPNDLEAVSPDNDIPNRNSSVNANKDSQNMEQDFKLKEDDSPPFEAIEETSSFSPQEENSLESHLSGISDLTSHDSNHSFHVVKTNELDVKNEDQNSQDSVDNQSSMETSESKVSQKESESTEEQMEISEDSNYSRAASDVTCENTLSFDGTVEANTKDSLISDDAISNDKIDTENLDNKPNNTDNKQNNVEKQNNEDNKESNTDDKEKRSNSKHNSDKYASEKNHKSTSDKHRNDKSSKSDNHKSDKHKRKSTNDPEKEDKDSKRSSRKRSLSKSDKDRKTDKYSSKTKHSSSRDKSLKNSVSETSEQSNGRHTKDKSISEGGDHKNDSKGKDSHKNKNPSNEKNSLKREVSDNSKKDKNDKQKRNNNESSKKSSSDSKHKDKSTNHSSRSKSKSAHHSSRDRGDSKSHSKQEESKSSHRSDAKHHSKGNKHSSSNKKEKHDKDRKESKSDDHHNSKEKRFSRRSTDRDSSDGRSGTRSSSSSFTDTYSSQLQKSNDNSTKINSGSNSGDSGNSDQTEVICNSDEISLHNAVVNEFQQIKLIKPKFASNIYEARRLLKIRKKISKIERQNQIKLLNNTAVHNNFITNSVAENTKLKDRANKAVENISANKEDSENNISSNIKNSHSKEETEKNSLEEMPIQPPKSPTLLSTSVVSKEHWDTLEAKLVSEHILNADHTSYDNTDNDEETEYRLPHKANASVDVKISNNSKDPDVVIVENHKEEHVSEIIQKKQFNDTDHPTNIENVEVPKSSDKDCEVNKNCLYLVPEVLPETQRFFDKIANRIILLEEEIARRTKLLVLHMENQKNKSDEIDVSKRLPKVDIVDVNKDIEITITPSKSKMDEVDNHQEQHNNKRKFEFVDVDKLDENTETQTAEPSTLEKSCAPTKLKRKKIKLAHNSVEGVAFNLPLSPADSDKSISSNNEKLKSNSNTSVRRNSGRLQSYANDDLYKPRLRYASSRRRIAANAGLDGKK